MKFIVLLGLFGLMAVQAAPPNVPIIAESQISDPSGQYSYSFTAANGIQARSRGVLVPNDEGTGNVLIIDGQTSYTSPEGRLITLEYTADKTGFHPKGDHLPKV